MPDWILRIHEPGLDVRDVPVVADMVLGKDPECHCVLRDPSASDRHATLREVSGELSIEDLGSATQTLILGGQRLSQGESAPVRPGVRFRIGETSIEIVEPEALSSATEPTVAPGVEARAAALRDSETVRSGPASLGMDPSLAKAVSTGILKQMRPRLVVDTPEWREVIPIERGDFLVGRGSRHAPQLSLAHDRVSAKHARIFLDGYRFFLEDLGSTNRTYLGSEALAPHAPRELQPDTLLRFGPVGVLFVTDCDKEGRPVAKEGYEKAAELLEKQVPIGRQQMAQARTRQVEASERGFALHIGEVLIERGLISADRWVEALEQARLLESVEAAGSKRDPNVVLVVLLFLAFIAAVLGFWRPWA